MGVVDDLRIRIFADGADLDAMRELAANPLIQGFTTNPTLMRKSGVADYEAFARTVLDVVGDRPVSFEVTTDEFPEMERQGRLIAAWAENVYVKVPCTNTRGESAAGVVRALSEGGARVNVTAILTIAQVEEAAAALAPGPGGVISVFAGRIADTGRDPMPLMREAVALAAASGDHLEVLWASPREVLNVVQADQVGCHIITATSDVLAKLPVLGKDLGDHSLDTVRMFHEDARHAGLHV